MTDSYKILYEPIPDAVSGGSGCETAEIRNVQLKTFLGKHLAESERKEIDEECKKTFPLHRQKVGKIKKPQLRRKGKYLTAFERRKLGLNRLPRNGLDYDDFKEINKLWLGYMTELLPSLEDRKLVGVDESLQMRVCRADFHGAHVKVTKSNVASQVGIEGFVVMETKNTFQIISKDNKLKTIPKRSTSLSFVLNGHLITVGCSNFVMRPSERAVKKWKNKAPFDL